MRRLGKLIDACLFLLAWQLNSHQSGDGPPEASERASKPVRNPKKKKVHDDIGAQTRGSRLFTAMLGSFTLSASLPKTAHPLAISVQHARAKTELCEIAAAP